MPKWLKKAAKVVKKAVSKVVKKVNKSLGTIAGQLQKHQMNLLVKLRITLEKTEELLNIMVSIKRQKYLY